MVCRSVTLNSVYTDEEREGTEELGRKRGEREEERWGQRN